MSTSTANTRNTGNGTTSSPGFGAGLVAGLFSDGVCLPLIFSNALYKPTHVSPRSNNPIYQCALWTCWTTSSLIGAVKTAGRVREPEASISNCNTSAPQSHRRNDLTLASGGGIDADGRARCHSCGESLEDGRVLIRDKLYISFSPCLIGL